MPPAKKKNCILKAKLLHAILAIKGLNEEEGSTIDTITNYALLNLPVTPTKTILKSQIRNVLTTGVHLGIVVKVSNRYQVRLGNLGEQALSDDELSDVDDFEEADSTINCQCTLSARKCIENSKIERLVRQKARTAKRRLDVPKSSPPCKRRRVETNELHKPTGCMVKKNVKTARKKRVRFNVKAAKKKNSLKTKTLVKSCKVSVTSLKKAMRNYKVTGVAGKGVKCKKTKVKGTKVKRKPQKRNVKTKKKEPARENDKEDSDSKENNVLPTNIQISTKDEKPSAPTSRTDTTENNQETNPYSNKTKNGKSSLTICKKSNTTEKNNSFNDNESLTRGDDNLAADIGYSSGYLETPRNDEDISTDEDSSSQDDEQIFPDDDFNFPDDGETPSNVVLVAGSSSGDVEHDVEMPAEDSGDENVVVVKMTGRERNRLERQMKKAKRIFIRSILATRKRNYQDDDDDDDNDDDEWTKYKSC